MVFHIYPYKHKIFMTILFFYAECYLLFQDFSPKMYIKLEKNIEVLVRLINVLQK